MNLSNATTPDRAVTHSTFVIERSFPVSPERVFAAFSDPAKKQRWYAERAAFPFEEFQMDFRAGGKDYTRFRFPEGSPFPGAPLEYHTSYQDIVPNRRIVYAYSMGVGGRCVSASLVTFEFLTTDNGTELVLTEQGAYFEGSGGPEMREAGWRALLDSLASEVAR
jgi:uncharacterized protein YndB with AHSA1/START domain